MRSSLDVVVVNWNAGDDLRACLGSIPAALDASFELRRVVVVDNASSDGSLAGLDHQGLPLSVIRNAGNRGFGAACNQGARAGGAEFLLFLNPDVRLLGGSLAVPLAHLARPEAADVGVSGVQLEGEGGRVARSCARFPRAATFLWTATGLDRLLPALRLGYRMSEWDHAATRDVDHVMGAFYLVRRRAFEAVGGFDERFFVYFEDLDLSLRLARAGWRARYVADARALHRGGGTTRRIRGRALAYFLRGKLRYARKHHGRAGFLCAALSTLLVEPWCRALAALAAWRLGELRAVLAAYALLWVPEPRGGGADIERERPEALRDAA